MVLKSPVFTALPVSLPEILVISALSFFSSDDDCESMVYPDLKLAYMPPANRGFYGDASFIKTLILVLVYLFVKPSFPEPIDALLLE